MAYEKPNYTQLPNRLLDDHLPTMKEAELKVVLAIARQTFGWHKQSDKISHSQLMRATGLSRQGVQNGLDDGLKRGVIKRVAHGIGFLYSLELVNEVDRSTMETSQRSRPELVNEVDQTGLRSRLTKETNKRNNKETFLLASDTLTSFAVSDRVGAHHQPTVKEKNVSSQQEDPRAESPIPPKSRATPPSPRRGKAEAHPLTSVILDAYVEARGKNGINYKAEGAWAKKIAEEWGHLPTAPTLVKGCYAWMDAQEFWQSNVIRLSHIYERMANYVRHLEREGMTVNADDNAPKVLNVDWSSV